MSAPPEPEAGLGRRELWLLAGVALLVRLAKGALTPVIAEDGVAYIAQSDLFLAGRLSEALGAHYPPVYPALVALARLVLQPWPGGEPVADAVAAGKIVSALLGALTVLPLASLGGSIFPRRAVRAALWLYIVTPFILSFSGDVLSESTFVFLSTLFLAACYRAAATGRLAAGAVAGTAAGLALLTRPEGLILIPFGAVAIPVLSRGSSGGEKGEEGGAEGGAEGARRSRLPAIILCSGLALAPLVIYTAHLRATTGHWQFSRKGGELLAGLWRYADATDSIIEGGESVDFDGGVTLTEALSVIGRNRGLFARKYAHDLRDFFFKRIVQAVHPVAAFPVFFGWVLRVPRGRREWTLIGFLVWWLLCISVHWANARYLLPMATPALLWGGAGLERLAWLLARGHERWARRLALVLLVGVVLGMGLRAAMPERPEKIGLRLAGEVIAARSKGARVCSRWRRVAFYAGAEHVPLPWAPGADGDALRRYCEERGAEYIVLRRGTRGEEFLTGLRPDVGVTMIEVGEYRIFHLRAP